MKKLILTPILFSLALMFSACGKIPTAYQGVFVDASSGTRLELTSDSGKFADSSGRAIDEKAYSLDFKDLAGAQPGIYVQPNPANANEILVYWLRPDLTSRREEQGFVWLTSEVFYTRMNIQLKDKVPQIEMIHCMNGLLMLDTPSQTWNGGCPAEHEDLILKRSS